MEEDTEYKKLPIEERCMHKLWKARLHGYDEAIKRFREIEDEKSNEWNKYIGMIKKFVIDPHAMAQERGLEATFIFVENCSFAGKVSGDIMSGIVLKCIATQKSRTRELAVQIALMFIEIDKQDVVTDELVKGLEHKNPKIVSACAATVTQALKEFGIKVINVKPLIKLIPILLSNRDNYVRNEGKLLCLEIYRWTGDALKPQLSSLAPVILTELEAEFTKLKRENSEPYRFLRSQQEKKLEVNRDADNLINDNTDIDSNHNDEMDPLDLIDPVDILSQLPKDFYDKLDEKKWQIRKESLECVELLLQSPKLAPGDYSDLVKGLRKVLSKDSNVVLVAIAGKCIGSLARGLGKKFQPYALICVPAVLEKFKEKKSAVVTSLREAIDFIYPCLSLEAMQEDFLESLNNKNPSVKTETALFLSRAFSKTPPAIFNKKLLKSMTGALVKTLNESDPLVRDASAEALGVLTKLLSEKTLLPYLSDVDALKLVKIKECAEKAVILVKVQPKMRPSTAPIATENHKILTSKAKDIKAIKRPASSNTVKKNSVRKPQPINNMKDIAAARGCSSERELTAEELITRANEILPQNIISELEDSNWKTRMNAIETMNNIINNMEIQTDTYQILLRILCKKPGLKDTNFQVIKVKLDLIKKVIELFGINTTIADHFICDITEKLGDSKNNMGAAMVLTTLAEKLTLNYVVYKVISFAFEQKSPKVQAESVAWMSNAIIEFGMQINVCSIAEELQKAVQSINPTVRQAGISAIGVLHLYTGNSLMMYFDNEKPAVKQQIQSEFDKNENKKPPLPTRGFLNTVEMNSDGKCNDNDTQEHYLNIKDACLRIDISPQITEALLAEIADKNWKTRNEGLNKLQGILNDAKLVEPTIGDLPLALSLRLVDSNAKIAQSALAICQQLATAMGPTCKQYIRVLFPGFLNGLGDGKQFIRTASITCINIWGEQCGFKEFFDGEMLADALKTGSPALRTELWGWLAEKLPIIAIKTIPKDELTSCLPMLYSNICDRNAEVRKKANDAVYGFMIHLSYDIMVKLLERTRPASKKDVQTVLDKTRPNLPVKPLPKSKQQAPIIEDPPKSTKNATSKIQKTASSAKVNQGLIRKKEEEIDTSPILSINNIKCQRLLDEQKLKVLKWAFSSPRDEFTELLRDQMTTACINKGLMANMFHDDFRYHLKAIETLIEDLPNNSKALICNLDLILKWISLRFYDTNPSVLLKGLEYLNLVFLMLGENEYDLAENEGGCFIPHLLIKIGDPKDTVRHGVRSLFRQMCEVYPYTKIFVFIMEGLKSKNARQRTECLDELSYLIERYGLNACQPSSQSALKEIAKHISDRDNSVRNAALNCVVQAYFLTGEKVYKLIGNLNEKDLSMLDERIKRAKKTRKTNDVPKTSDLKMENIVIEEDFEEVIIEPDIIQDDVVTVSNDSFSRQIDFQQITKPKTLGPFGLDPHIIAEIEKDWVRSDELPRLEISKLDLNFLNSPLKIVEKNGISYPTEKLEQLIARPPQHMPTLVSYGNLGLTNKKPTLDRIHTASANLANELPKLDPNIVRIIRGIGSSDSITARASLNEINDILESPDKQAALREYEELYINSICVQFKHLSQLPTSESLIMYQPVLSSTYTFFTSKSLGKDIGVDTLKKLMSVLLGLMADHKLTNGDDGQYTKVINGICLRILDRTNFSHLNCALIRLLKETCRSAGLPKFTDLLMKCIWRNVKVMPEKSQELDFSALLLEIHEFMTALPTVFWAQRPVDTPLRTVKTIIHNMAKLKGNDILQDLNGIPDQSELHAYLMRVLKNIQKENSIIERSSQLSGTEVCKNDNKFTSKQTHEAMSHIFKLIADKETSSEGIGQLYEFMKQHSDVDLSIFYRGSNAVFQKYIEDGLAEIGRSMEDKISAERVNMISGSNNSTQNKLDPDYWVDKLNFLKNKAIVSPRNYDDRQNNVIAAEITQINQIIHASNIANGERNDPISSNRLELLQHKLSQIRQRKQT